MRSIRGMRIIELGTIIAAGFFIAGCGAILDEMARKKPVKGVGMGEVKQAESKKDMTKLTSICKHEVKGTATEVCTEACNAILRIVEAGGDVEVAHKYCQGTGGHHKLRYYGACKLVTRLIIASVKKGDCSKLEQNYASHDRRWYSLGKAASKEIYMVVGQRAAQCKNWDFIWSSLSKTHYAHQLLIALDKEGKPVVEELMTYLQKNRSNPFGFDTEAYAHNATRSVVTFLLKTGKHGDCKRFIPFAKNTDKNRLAEWLTLFEKTKCASAAPLALARLSDAVASYRRDACNVLGQIGNKRHVSKLNILANTDPAFKIQRLNKVWFVRDACRAAVGRIKMRN